MQVALKGGAATVLLMMKERKKKLKRKEYGYNREKVIYSRDKIK